MITSQDIADNFASMKQINNWVYSVCIDQTAYIVKLAEYNIHDLHAEHRNAMVNSTFGILSCPSRVIPLDTDLQKQLLLRFKPKFKIIMSHALCMTMIDGKSIRSNTHSRDEKDRMNQHVVDQLYPRYIMAGYTDFQKKHVIKPKNDNRLYTIDTEYGLYTTDNNNPRPYLEDCKTDIAYSVQKDFHSITDLIKGNFPKNPVDKDLFLQICEENICITEDRFPVELYETGGPVQEIMHARAKELISYAQKKLR